MYDLFYLLFIIFYYKKFLCYFFNILIKLDEIKEYFILKICRIKVEQVKEEKENKDNKNENDTGVKEDNKSEDITNDVSDKIKKTEIDNNGEIKVDKQEPKNSILLTCFENIDDDKENEKEKKNETEKEKKNTKENDNKGKNISKETTSNNSNGIKKEQKNIKKNLFEDSLNKAESNSLKDDCKEKENHKEKEDELQEEYYVLDSEIKLFHEKEIYDFFNLFSLENYFNKNHIKSNSKENIINKLSNDFERKTHTNLRFSKSLTPSNNQNQKNSFIQSNPNIIYISDLFPKVHLFGLYDMPLYFNNDFIKLLKLKIPKNIFTLNELKEYLISELTKEAKRLSNEKSTRRNIEEDKFLENSKLRNIIYLKNGDYNSLSMDHQSENIAEQKAKEMQELNKDENVHFLVDYFERIFEDLTNHKEQSDIYINFLREIDKDNICQIISHIITIKGYVKKSINFILREKYTDTSHLLGFIIILIGVMKCDGINNFFNFFYPKGLVYEELNIKKKFLRLYKEINSTKYNLLDFQIKIENEKTAYYEMISK